VLQVVHHDCEVRKTITGLVVLVAENNDLVSLQHVLQSLVTLSTCHCSVVWHVDFEVGSVFLATLEGTDHLT
jgi:uncharacterized membrane protein